MTKKAKAGQPAHEFKPTDYVMTNYPTKPHVSKEYRYGFIRELKDELALVTWDDGSVDTYVELVDLEPSDVPIPEQTDLVRDFKADLDRNWDEILAFPKKVNAVIEDYLKWSFKYPNLNDQLIQAYKELTAEKSA